MRKILQNSLLLAIAMLLPLQMVSTVVFASNAPVQFSIPDTTLLIKGFASPNAFVKIFDGDALIGTVIADASGVFEKNFQSMSAGLHNIQMSYDDTDGIASDSVSQTISIRAQSNTALEYYLPPTLLARPVSLVEGDFATFSGSTIPNATVEIILDGGNLILRPQSDASGHYTISVDTTGYYFGEHNVIATSSQGGLSSFQTLKKPFIILPIESGAGDGSETDGANLNPPIIIAPGGEIETEEETVLIKGTAPVNSQIIIYLDGEPIGSTFSNSDGIWFFNIDVSAPLHEVRAVACSGGSCSAFSNLVLVKFIGEFGQCSILNFILTDYRYWGVKESDGIDLNITGISGTPPYEILVDWGDDVTERFNRNDATSFNLHHVYDQEGQFNGRITVSDSFGCDHTRYFSVNVDEGGLGNAWLLLLIPGTLFYAYELRRRYKQHRKKLILAR